MSFYKDLKISSLFNENPLKIKNKGSKVFLLILSALMISSLYPLISCTPQQPPIQIGPSLEGDPEERGRNRSRLSRRSRRVNCRNLGSGGSCEGNFDCEDICEEIFSKHTAESKCIDLNENLVADFYEIFVIMEDGDDFESINPDSLNCLLNVSDTEFSREVGKLRKAESETFLEVLALDEDLTDVLSSEENILEKLLDNIDEGVEALKEKIDGSSNFIDLIVENENEEAWEWVLEYIREECESTSEDYCGPSTLSDIAKRELVFFCNTYKDSTSKLDDLLDSTFFNEEYGSDIDKMSVCGDGSGSCDSGDEDDFLGGSSANTVCKDLAGIHTGS